MAMCATNYLLILSLLLWPTAADAQATVTFRAGKSWNQMLGPGKPSFTIAGRRLSAGPQTVATPEVMGRLRLSFWTDLQSGHHYTVGPDPCCFVAIDDEADLSTRFAAHGLCERAKQCPAGTQSVPSFVYNDRDKCGAENSCLPPVKLRARSTVPVRIRLFDDECGDPEPLGAEYQAIAFSRASPQVMCVFREDKLVWKGRVLFRLDHHYTLTLTDGPPQLHIDD
jgi:hypothetical protein